MMEKVKPVLDTSYKPYVSDSNQKDNNKPKFYRTMEGHLVLKKIVVFYNKVSMPCVLVPEKDSSSIKTTNAIQKLITNIKHIILLGLIQESGNYKTVTALVGVDPKYTSKKINKFINNGRVLAAEKSLCVSTIFLNQNLIGKWLGGNGGSHKGLAQFLCIHHAHQGAQMGNLPVDKLRLSS
ncbi:hypothetical protein DSO57_1006237 [Entomophthora muscae]|uniref:Uncharacterized protein n=1 Tax=Entomophthora muscae TaxID=34485 RepID=A0ACC2RYX3_9FUNG|nr:hypothetical protein DSO57_1006237 [Entomophthora muscae]